MPVVVITAPEPIVTLEEAKRQLRVDHDDDDGLIDALVAAAQAEIEPPKSWVGASFGVQTLELRTDRFDPCGIALPFPPVRSIVSVKYDDASGVEQTLAGSVWSVSGIGVASPRLNPAWGQSWPSIRPGAEAVRVRYEAGYDADDPQLLPAKQAVLMTVADLYMHRETVVVGTIAASLPVALTVERLLQRYRVYA